MFSDFILSVNSSLKESSSLARLQNGSKYSPFAMSQRVLPRADSALPAFSQGASHFRGRLQTEG